MNTQNNSIFASKWRRSKDRARRCKRGEGPAVGRHGAGAPVAVEYLRLPSSACSYWHTRQDRAHLRGRAKPAIVEDYVIHVWDMRHAWDMRRETSLRHEITLHVSAQSETWDYITCLRHVTCMCLHYCAGVILLQCRSKKECIIVHVGDLRHEMCSTLRAGVYSSYPPLVGRCNALEIMLKLFFKGQYLGDCPDQEILLYRKGKCQSGWRNLDRRHGKVSWKLCNVH